MPIPTRERLPGVLQEDKFLADLVDALDSVLAPVHLVLDCLDAYFDPRLAPADFLEWLANWVAVALDETWSEERKRELVRRAIPLYRTRGTMDGLREQVRIYAGVDPELKDSGGVSYSTIHGGAELPGLRMPSLVVKLQVPSGSHVTAGRLESIVHASVPAHVGARVELVTGK
ncbi:MAG: phage tail protein I [Actinomycetota bacterium]|nr:phage tail protein I [Actinomycetota bacterium]